MRGIYLFLTVLTVFSHYSAFGESGSASDVTGVIVTTSDQLPVRNNISRNYVRPRFLIRLYTFKSKMSMLIQGVAIGFPTEIQQDLATVMFQSEGYSVSAQNISDGLTATMGELSSELGNQVVENMIGLIEGRKISPPKFRAAVQSYNQLIKSLPPGSLKNPSYELSAIKWALSPARVGMGRPAGKSGGRGARSGRGGRGRQGGQRAQN